MYICCLLPADPVSRVTCRWILDPAFVVAVVVSTSSSAHEYNKSRLSNKSLVIAKLTTFNNDVHQCAIARIRYKPFFMSIDAHFYPRTSLWCVILGFSPGRRRCVRTQMLEWLPFHFRLGEQIASAVAASPPPSSPPLCSPL